MRSERLIVALDVGSIYEAALLAERVLPYCGKFKVRLPLIVAGGIGGIKLLGLPPVMIDLKAYDIPSSVADDVRSVLPLNPWAVTVHASGGERMIESARLASEVAGKTRPLVLAVTVLTSLTAHDLQVLGFRSELHKDPVKLVRRLTLLALDAGADGVVCSALEVKKLRASVGPEVTLVTPGMQVNEADNQDQARTGSPEDAVRAGADFVVVGRAIRCATDPAALARDIAKGLNDPEPGGGSDGEPWPAT